MAGWRVRRRAAVATVLAACGAGFGSWVLAAHPDASRKSTAALTGARQVVPWADLPATVPVAAPQPTPAASYRQCRGADLAAKFVGGGAGMGHSEARIRLTNTGGSPCTLSGYPTRLTAKRADGTTRRLRFGDGGYFSAGTYWPADLRPGASSTTAIETSSACSALNSRDPKPDPFVAAALGLPGGGVVSVRAAFDAVCGVSLGNLGHRAPAEPDPLAYPDLSIGMDRPDTVRAGTTMHFTVTLTNNGDHAVRLDPCPVYSESIYLKGSHQHAYQLNCSRVTLIAAHNVVTFAMQVPVPDERGVAKFGWSIPTSVNLVSGGALRIV